MIREQNSIKGAHVGVKPKKSFDFTTQNGINRYLNDLGLGTDSKEQATGKLYVAKEKVRAKSGLTSEDRKAAGVKSNVYIATYDKEHNPVKLVYADKYEDLMIGISVLAHIFKDHTPLNDMVENENVNKARYIIKSAGQSTPDIDG